MQKKSPFIQEFCTGRQKGGSDCTVEIPQHEKELKRGEIEMEGEEWIVEICARRFSDYHVRVRLPRPITLQEMLVTSKFILMKDGRPV